MKFKEGHHIYVNSNNLETLPDSTIAYPYFMDATDVTEFPVPWHWHAELEFIYVIEGAEEIVTNRAVYTAKAGEAYFLNTNVLDMKRSAPGMERTREYGHIFHPILLAGHFGSIIETEYINPVLNDTSIELVLFTPETENGRAFIRKIRQLTQMQEEAMQEHRMIPIQVRSCLSEMWLLLLEQIREGSGVRGAAGGFGSDRIRLMIQYINMHYPEKITLADIAASAFISEREVSRLFRSTMQKTPMEYLTEVRLDHARALLRDGARSITEISMECGFSDSAYFARIFQKKTGMTPREYRKQRG